MSDSDHHSIRDAVDRHFSGRIRPAEERAMREHLPDCEECRHYYDRHLLLARADTGSIDSKTRLALGLGISARRRSWVWALPAVAAVAAATLLFVLSGSKLATDDGFTARGAVQPSAAELRVYRVLPQGAASAVLDRIDANDELAFAYRNPAGARYLMVFARDEAGGLYWYVPVWLEPGSNPSAAPIVETETLTELPTAVRQQLPRDEVWLHAIFMTDEVAVQQVEDLARRLPASTQVPLGGVNRYELLHLLVDWPAGGEGAGP